MRPPFGGFLATIVAESKDVAEFARRAEAWASTEARPMTYRAMARRWRASRGGFAINDVVSLMLHARTWRVTAQDESFQRIIRAASRGGKDE